MSNKQQAAFVTGNSSGLGLGLSEVLLDQGWHVYGCSRRGCNLTGDISDVICDLANLDAIEAALNELLGHIDELDLVILNAGKNAGMKLMTDTPMAEIKNVMDINVWANKIIFDWLKSNVPSIGQIILVTSGAGVGGNKGWSSYALSKATLNMLAKLYAHEFAPTHVAAIAPGVTMSEMLGQHLDSIDLESFPTLRHFVEAREVGTIQSPAEAARRMLNVREKLKEHASGRYFDPTFMRDFGDKGTL